MSKKNKPASTGQALDNLNETLCKLFGQSIAEHAADDIIEMTVPIVRQKLEEEFGLIPQKHEIITPKGTAKLEGVFHEKFDTVLNLVSNHIPVFLTGAAGSGKNVLCKQIAEALKLNFFFTNAVTQEYKLTGFIDANGTFHETQFYHAFKDGGLFFLDEMDGSVPEVLIMLNAAIANGYFDFPIGQVVAHPDFRVIAAGNTFGTGADVEYTGRYQLDAASLDRFALVEIGYSPKIERALAGGDSALVEFIRDFRNAVKSAGIRHLASYRSIERIHKLSGGIKIDEALRISLLKNITRDDLYVLFDNMPQRDNNKYYRALKDMLT